MALFAPGLDESFYKLNVIRNDLLIMMDDQKQNLEFFMTFFLSLLMLVLLLSLISSVQTVATFIKMSINKGLYKIGSNYTNNPKKRRTGKNKKEDEMQLLEMS